MISIAAAVPEKSVNIHTKVWLEDSDTFEPIKRETLIGTKIVGWYWWKGKIGYCILPSGKKLLERKRFLVVSDLIKVTK